MIDIIEAKDMCKIKMIAIDVDGTLLNSKKELTKKVKDTILRAQSAGIKVVIATGRPLSGIKPLLNELKLANQKDQYVICFGGGVVETTSENILLEKTLTYDDYVDLEAISLKLGLHFMLLLLIEFILLIEILAIILYMKQIWSTWVFLIVRQLK